MENKQSGFTLIEALVALLLLSVGLLGVAAMQIKAVQSTQVSYHRSVASLMATDASELLWSRLGETCPNRDVSTTNDLDDIVGLWLASGNWGEKLPNVTSLSTISEGEEDCSYIINVVWDDERFGVETVSNLSYYVLLLDREV